jgi:hypothetical protein
VRTPATPARAFALGDRVWVIDKTHAMVGCIGEAKAVSANTGKFDVIFSSGKRVAFRAEQLRKV